MTDELRDKITEALHAIRFDYRDCIEYRDCRRMAEMVLEVPEIAAALRQAKMIADEPESWLIPHGRGAGHDDFLARLRKVGMT